MSHNVLFNVETETIYPYPGSHSRAQVDIWWSQASIPILHQLASRHSLIKPNYDKNSTFKAQISQTLTLNNSTFLIISEPKPSSSYSSCQKASRNRGSLLISGMMRGAHPNHMLTNDASSSVSCNSVLQVFERLDRSKLLLNGNSLPACQVHDIPWKLHLENPGYGVSSTDNNVNSLKLSCLTWKYILYSGLVEP